MTRIIGIIPARMDSSRFPGKPLASLCGKPMIQHVYERTAGCALLERVFIATCDKAIASTARKFGAEVQMTSSAHERATDRVAEASADDPASVVVMVQGDEPMIQPSMIAAVITPMLADPEASCVNLVARIRSEEGLSDRNTIKVAVSRTGTALYFSREPIPARYGLRFEQGAWYKQVCIIAFRREALQSFASLPQGPLETAESIDMLRFLESGVAVHIVETSVETFAVDTPRDLERVSTLLMTVVQAN